MAVKLLILFFLFKVTFCDLRITNGTVARQCSIPFQALIEVSDERDSFLCGGVVLTTTAILTAAHCLQGKKEATISLGLYNLKNDPLQKIKSRNFVVHENFSNKLPFHNDIGIILLENDSIEFNDCVRAVEMVPDGFPKDYAGLEGQVSGWGVTDPLNPSESEDLMVVNNTVISNEECKEKLGLDLGEDQLCMSGLDWKAACIGDSGGGLVVGNYLIGLVSFGIDDCKEDMPSVYVRIDGFKDWIKDHSGSGHLKSSSCLTILILFFCQIYS